MKVIEMRKAILAAGVIVLGLCGLAVGGSALEFDGVDDYVEVADDDSLTPSDGLTVSAWIYINAVSWIDRTAIVCKYAYVSPDRSYTLELGKGGNPDKSSVCLVVSETTNPFSGKITCGTTELQAGQWYHVVGTFEPNHQEIYINGVEETDDVDPQIADSIANSNEPLYIGYNKTEDTYFDGLIDEVAIYSRALDVDEIGQIYHCGVFDDANLVGYWDFEEGQGQVAYDNSGYGNDGQLGSSGDADSADPARVSSELPGVTYHIDVINGDNGNDGLTKETAFASIQKGIDSAEDCDRVLVWPGVYNESLFFINKAITVQSAADAAEIVASGIYAVSLYTAEGPNSILKNFVIRDSDTGVYVSSGAPWLEHLTIVNCDLGIEGEGGADPNIVNSILWNNAYDLFQCEAEYSWVEEEIEPNLVSYWRFEEGSGTTAYDWVGDNDGTIYGATWTSGQVGGALDFDGSNDYVEVVDPGDESLDFGSGNFTISLWFKTTDTDGEVVDKSGGNKGRQTGYSVYVGTFGTINDGEIGFRVSDGTNRDLIKTNNTYNDGGWHHLAAVRTGSGSANLDIYVDGVDVSTSSVLNEVASGISNSYDLSIGAKYYAGYTDVWGNFLNGGIDEVGIWDRALSAAEVEQLYEKGLAGHEYIDPVFADAEGGDYHLKSERGRYWPEHDVWVLDEVSSPCIDGGDARVQPSGEPAANGGRINMGAYGNTAYASMSEWPLRGDLSGDGVVDGRDLAIFVDRWLEAAEWK
ncbi:MAG: hypothetical protein JSV99_10280 [Planctomycetota bacterium]|nr:MAG: hypothetical protein JSV99_10280 [Planctomycetota bacterium]